MHFLNKAYITAIQICSFPLALGKASNGRKGTIILTDLSLSHLLPQGAHQKKRLIEETATGSSRLIYNHFTSYPSPFTPLTSSSVYEVRLPPIL